MWIALLLPLVRATDTWSDPSPGVRVLERVTSDQRIYAAYVDVCEDGMYARATTYEERRQTTSDWAESVGAKVAINAAFFSYTDYDAIGWSIGDGALWPTAVDYDHYTAIGFGPYGRVEIFDTEDTFPRPESWWREMVPGDPLLIDDGVIVREDCYSHMCEDHPRTAVGLSGDGREVILVAVDGRTTGAAGMTRLELADLMLDLGAWRAMNLDGGGSTTMWVEGRGVINRPSDSAGERVVASHLGFLSVPGTPGCCIPTAVAGATGVFEDVADSSWVKPYAEALYAAGITSGCSSDPLMFCPDCTFDRGTLAVFLARGAGLAPVTPTTFTDVDPADWRAPYIEALYRAGITTGCDSSPARFCPDEYATRWEAAVFLYRAGGFLPATPTGRFDDLTDTQAAIAESLANACVTSGCDSDSFCPDRPLTRGELAKLEAVALSVPPFSPCLDTDTGTDSGVDSGTDSGVDSGTDSGVDSGQSVDSGTPDSGTDPGTAHPVGDGDTDASVVKDPTGCGCASAPAPADAASVTALGLLGAVVWRRRRSAR